MTSALLVAVVFLAIVTFGNILLLFAVIRRLRNVQELVVPPAVVPAVGTAIEPFQVETVDGASVTTDALADGPVLVAVLSTTCPACKDLAGTLATLSGPSSAPLVLVVADPGHDGAPMLQALAGMDRVAVVEREHPALTALGGITAYPTVLAIREGKITSAGTRLDKVLPAVLEKTQVTAR
jgi:thiol-disulfide isomerase/thioredoxin